MEPLNHEVELPVEDIIQSKISNKIRHLHDLFSTGNFATEKGSAQTNLINVAEKRTYCLPQEIVPEFFVRLEACRKENLLLHYAERQETDALSHSGIMLDFDQYQKTSVVQITDEHYGFLVHQIATQLAEYIDFLPYMTSKSMSYHAFFIRKPTIVLTRLKDGSPAYKDGFHILVPEIQILKGLKHHLVSELLSRNVLRDIFEGIDRINSDDQLIDWGSVRNPVHFFGNSKVGAPPYLLECAYKVTMRAMGGMISINCERFSGDAIHALGHNLSYELSLGTRLDSIGGRPTWLKKRAYDIRTSLVTTIRLATEKAHKDMIPDDEIDAAEATVDILALNNSEAAHVKALLGVLPLEYATEYSKWFKVVCAIAHTSENFKPLAVWFSHRVPDKWSSSEVDRVWKEATGRRYEGTPITKRSLMYWARTEAPEAYAEADRMNYMAVLARMVYQNEGRIEHANVAKLLHVMIGDKFAADYTDESARQVAWYEFVTPGQSMRKGEVFKWRREDSMDNIHLYLAEHLPKLYQEIIAQIRERKEQADNDALAKYWREVEKTLRNYCSRLASDPFHSGVLRQATYWFRRRGFVRDLDAAPDIIGVGNGVLRIGANPELITTHHEYRVSKYTSTDYEPYNPDSPYVKHLMQILRDIYPDPDVLEFILCHSATALDARESDYLMVLLYGSGQNGKSTLLKFIQSALEDMYVIPGKSQLLTSPLERGESANSAQMHMKGKRYCYFDEFEDNATLNPARVKSIVSPGSQSGRDLHERQSSFRNTCTTIAASNWDLRIPTTDHGIWRRIYYHRMKCKFTSHPDPSNPYERKIDERVNRSLPDNPHYKRATLSLLVHYYSIYATKYGYSLRNIPVPTIARETEEYRVRQDAIHRFITRMVVVSPGAEPVCTAVLATKYAEWYRQYIGKNAISLDTIESQFDNSALAAHFVLETDGNRYLRGYRIRDSVADPLREGESRFESAGKSSLHWKQSEEIQPSVHVDISDAATNDDIIDDNIADYLQAPLHVQHEGQKIIITAEEMAALEQLI